MNVPWRKKNETWLLVFVGGFEGDEQAVRDCLARASEIIGRNSPVFYTEHINACESRQIPSVPCVDNEISEMFSLKILNDVIKWKGDYGATQIAIILPNKAFSSEEVFVKVVKNRIFCEPNYHAICSTGNFLATDRRKHCVKTMDCTRCNELFNECEHSCLIRLIWLMFGSKDERVLEVFDSLDFREE